MKFNTEEAKRLATEDGGIDTVTTKYARTREMLKEALKEIERLSLQLEEGAQENVLTKVMDSLPDQTVTKVDTPPGFFEKLSDELNEE